MEKILEEQASVNVLRPAKDLMKPAPTPKPFSWGRLGFWGIPPAVRHNTEQTRYLKLATRQSLT